MTFSLRALTTLSLITAILFLSFAVFAGASVTTDKPDYSFGETVTISGDGYLPGETVFIGVTTPYGYESGYATAGVTGNFSWQFTLPNDSSAIGDYSYIVIGQSSGVVQSGTFTDGNVKIFPIPTTATYSATKTIYSNTTCGGSVVSGPTVVNGISSPSGHTTGVGNTQSVKIQAAAFSDQGGAFLGWTTSETYVGTSTTAVTGDTICIAGSFTGNHDFFANYGAPPGILVVQKVLINDNGGTAATSTFSFQINGASTTPFNTEGKVTFSLASSTYSITELAAAGYTTTYANSKNGNANCTNLSVTSGATTTCTITNNDQPGTLNIVKNTTGGDGTFTFALSGTTTVPSVTTAGGTGSTTVTLNAGTFSLSEVVPTGWDLDSSSCSNGTPASFTVSNGSTTTCTFNDTKRGVLSVKKVLINDNGGTAATTSFSFLINGASSTPFEADGQNDLSVAPGTYTITEPFFSGYASSTSGCTNASVTAGATTTCTITNDDIAPLLTVSKVIINDDGGTATTTDFMLLVAGAGATTTVSSGAQNSFDAGNYTVSESGPSGYIASFSGDCDGNGNLVLEIGGTYTCTITNNDREAELTIVKHTIGGDATFGFHIGNESGTTTASLATSGGAATSSAIALHAGSYNVLEVAQSGWDLTGVSCEYAGASIGAPASSTPTFAGGETITVDAGDKVTCTFTNTKRPTLTVTKIVVNDNGGTATTTDFALFIDGVPTTSGSATTTTVGAHIVSETASSTYAATIGGDCAGDGSISLSAGQDANCTITNDDVAVPPPPSLCAPAAVAGTVLIRICNNGLIRNATAASADTGDNTALGSQGGKGGVGGIVDPPIGSENNGGASGGSGGAGGVGGRGGLIKTGNAVSSATTTNSANRSIIRAR